MREKVIVAIRRLSWQRLLAVGDAAHLAQGGQKLVGAI
jgi:hypothetical protein